MVVKVRGMKAAKIVQRIMVEQTGQDTPIIRDVEENERVYMVANTWLEPYGEQLVLDYVPRGTLVYCRTAPKAAPLSPPAGRLSDRTLSALRQEAAYIKERAASRLPMNGSKDEVTPRFKKAWLKEKKGRSAQGSEQRQV